MHNGMQGKGPRLQGLAAPPLTAWYGPRCPLPCLRACSPQTMMLGQEPRQTTSNVGHLNKPSIQVRAQWYGCLCV